MAHINTENKVDALFYLEELKPKFTKHCNLKGSLHEFIGTAYIVQKDWGWRNTDVQRNA
jgi:hypothetical protein